MTIKLYETKSYLSENDTVVTECFEEKGKIYIKLAETIFFPEEGGQYADTGVLTPIGPDSTGNPEFTEKTIPVRVLDGKLKNGEVSYLVDAAIPAGTQVHCELDWEMRYMRMQQHTGEHILTGLLHNKYGFNNVGFHLSDTAPVTLDLNGTLTPEQVAGMEIRANEVIYANLPVIDSYPSEEELPELTYRSKIEIEGQVRLITIGNPEQPIDICACCAPHVSRTGEVGIIKVISVQNYKGGTRISILCGKRALLHYQAQWNTLNQIAGMYSTAPESVADVIAKQKEENGNLKFKLSGFMEQDLLRRIGALPEGQNGCLFIDAELSGNATKGGFNALADKYAGYAGLFVGNDEAGYRFFAGSRNLDTKSLVNGMRRELGAKGGGAGEMVQGKIAASRSKIEEFFTKL